MKKLVCIGLAIMLFFGSVIGYGAYHTEQNDLIWKGLEDVKKYNPDYTIISYEVKDGELYYKATKPCHHEEAHEYDTVTGIWYGFKG